MSRKEELFKTYHQKMYDDLFTLIRKFRIKELELLENIFEMDELHADTYLEES